MNFTDDIQRYDIQRYNLFLLSECQRPATASSVCSLIVDVWRPDGLTDLAGLRNGAGLPLNKFFIGPMGSRCREINFEGRGDDVPVT